MTPEEQEAFISEQDARKAAESLADQLKQELEEQQKLCNDLKEQNHKFFLRLTASDKEDLPEGEEVEKEKPHTTTDIVNILKGDK